MDRIPDIKNPEDVAKSLWWQFKVDNTKENDNPNEIKQFCMFSEDKFMKTAVPFLKRLKEMQIEEFLRLRD